jgi:hypothetical protein
VNIRPEGLEWLQQTHGVADGTRPCSRLYGPDESATRSLSWWHDIPLQSLEEQGDPYVHLVCQAASESPGFHYLRVPKSFFLQHIHDLDVSATHVRLHLSAEPGDLFTDRRGNGKVPFDQFHISNS